MQTVWVLVLAVLAVFAASVMAIQLTYQIKTSNAVLALGRTCFLA